MGANDVQRSASAMRGPRPSPPMDDTIGHMLSDLVNISHNIERYISSNPAALAQPKSLHADDVERIVRRVESHFKGKLEQLEGLVQEQKDVIVQLSRERDQWKKKAEALSSSASSAQHSIGDAVRSSIAQRSAALSELEKTWVTDEDVAAHAAAPKGRDAEIHQLRHILLEEKRQRLLVEEQTQSLTEQHAKVVNTLELRIRKQEKQLQVIMDAFEQQQGAQSAAVVPQAEDHANGTRGTPRSLKFRQRQLRFGDEPTVGFESHAAQRVVPERCTSTDITDVIEISAHSTGKTSPAAVPAEVPASTVPPLSGDAAMDDVTLFLANISKELESINDIEIHRQTKIAALS